MIAEVSANFSHDGWNGECQEIRTIARVKAVHRLNEPYPCHLNEVLERFAAVTEAARDVIG